MIHLSKTSIASPLGELIAVASKQGLCLLAYQEEAEYIESRLEIYHSPYVWTKAFNHTLTETKTWLHNYFAKNFEDLKFPIIDFMGSEFAVRAWKALLKIPVGKIQSYGELARKIGSPHAARAIGRVMGQNPITLMVPCHRILGSRRKLTGYSSGLDRKTWLLDHEGISYIN